MTQKDEPITRSTCGAVPGRRSALRTPRLWILSASVLAGAAIAAGTNGTEPARGQSNVTGPAYTVEASTCAPCHSGVVKSFAENPHAQPLITRDGKGVTCASCHGSQKAHIESGGTKSNMLDPALAKDKQVDDMCLSCHEGKHPTFERSPHGKSKVSCMGCHSIHAAGAPKYLLKVAQSELCFQCHSGVKPQFSMPFRHKVQEGLIECTDCHDPHGTLREELSVSFKRQDSFCINCHTRTAGPFAFEHAVVKTEGCTACHFPHGGPNSQLLIRANVDSICQLCHFPPPDPKTGAHMQRAKDQAGPSPTCTDCHTNIHGSDSSPAFLREK